MADSIGQAYVQILPTTKGFSSKLSSELGGGGGGGGALSSAGKSMGGKIIKGLAAAGIGIAVVKGVSSAISKGGELQQSLGGIEALFGKSADKVKQNASKAFSTVGVSANDYMENVTSFSAALIQGLNGDTAKAANIADMAMKDMGDNANRFGTDIESIQNAYQGFAKGNFTMLDNLKLGYGGTKTEMLRLLQDTGVVEDSVKNLDNVTFDQMIEGIHKAQEGLNVTGTTAKEASTTIQGSLASFKAIGEDLLGNLAIGADITPQISALLTTAQTFLTENLLPMVVNVITGLANNAGQLAGVFTTLLTSVGTEIINCAPALMSAAVTILMKLGEFLVTSAPALMTSAINLIVQLGNSLITALPQILPMVAQIVSELALTLSEPSNLEKLINTALALIMALVDGLNKALPILIDMLPTIVMNIVTVLIQNAPKLITAAIQLVLALVKGLLNAYSHIGKAWLTIFQKMKELFTKTDWKTLGKNIIDGVVNGLKNAGSALWNQMKTMAKQAWEEFKKAFKIGSPSKVMEDIAKWIPIGAAKGVSKNSYVFNNAMSDMVENNPIMAHGMNMSVLTRDNSSAVTYQGIYDAVRRGASDANPMIVLNNRVVSRELKGMGVNFA